MPICSHMSALLAQAIDHGSAVGMCVLLAKRASIVCAAFASYIVAQANLAQGDKPQRTCLFLTAAPVPGVIFRLKC